MSVRPYLWFLVGVGTLTLAMLATTAAMADHFGSVVAATAFSLGSIATSFRLNSRYWREKVSAASPVSALGASTLLMAAVYIWAAVALLLIYPVIGLNWDVGWLYAAGLACIAACLTLFARSLEVSGPDVPPRTIDIAVQLSAVHGIAVAAGIAGLVAGGKLQTLKQDWAANYVLLAGGFAIVFLTMFAIRAHIALTQQI